MNDYNQNNLKVCIQRKYDIVWQEANKCFHDMYIPRSKDLYPYLVYQIQGLEPEKLYNMTLHFERSDGSRWEDRGDKYYPSGPANAPLMSNTVWHELGPRSGKFWMTLGSSFMFLRVTCKIDCVLPPNTISLRLFHKYIPVLSIYMWPNNKSIRFPPATFRIAHTEFLAAPCPTKNERLSMLTKIRRKKNFTIREKIRSDGKDKPTIYATCRIEHYLTRAQEISAQPLWITVNKHPYLLQSDFNSSIHDEKVTDISEQECPVLQAEVDSISSFQDHDSGIFRDSTSFGPETEQDCSIIQVEVDSNSSIHDKNSDISSETEQVRPILQMEDYDAGEPHVNGFTSSVPQNNDVGEPRVNCFTSPVPQVNMEFGENQERIKIENSGSPRTDSLHLTDNVAGEQHVNYSTIPVPESTLEAGEHQERIKIENPESPQTNLRHPLDNVVSEPIVNGFTSPVPQVNMESEKIQGRIKIEIPDSAQADSRHLDNVIGELSPAPQLTMETEVTPRRIKLENPSSPQTDSRHPPVNCFQDTVSGDSVVNGCTSPILQKKRKSEEEQRRVKLENPSSPQTDSRHQPVNCFQDTVSGDSVVIGCTSPILQKKRKSGENQERIKLENPVSPQIDLRHLQNYVVDEPPVLQKKRRTGEIGSHYSDNHQVFPCAFFPQHQPTQTSNFANFPYYGMQPNPNHLTFYSQFNPRMMPNYPHSINHQVFPSANGFTFPHPLMTTYPRPFYPTTFNYSAYQNMPPNYKFPINFQAPWPSMTNGSYQFYQPNPDNSAWGNFPNSGRFL